MLPSPAAACVSQEPELKLKPKYSDMELRYLHQIPYSWLNVCPLFPPLFSLECHWDTYLNGNTGLSLGRVTEGFTSNTRLNVQLLDISGHFLSFELLWPLGL